MIKGETLFHWSGSAIGFDMVLPLALVLTVIMNLLGFDALRRSTVAPLKNAREQWPK